jgi:hypothetical protein
VWSDGGERLRPEINCRQSRTGDDAGSSTYDMENGCSDEARSAARKATRDAVGPGRGTVSHTSTSTSSTGEIH